MNAWAQVEPCSTTSSPLEMNAWVEVDPCVTITPPPPVTTANIFMEALVIAAPNTLPTLTHTPDGGFIMLTVNGKVFMPVGASPPFSVAGQAITWLSAIYAINVIDTVAVAYSYSS
jgi:hypothetical protein